jgi:hypothetical protein
VIHGRRTRAAAVLALALLAVAASCSSSGAGGGSAASGPSGGAGSTATTTSTGASLIPPSHATSPTSGPPNTDPQAAAEAPSAIRCEGYGAQPPSSTARPLDLRMALGATLETGRVRWALVVTNQSDRAITLQYPTSQDGDVVLRDRGGDVAYRWSAGQVFAQQVRCQVIGGRQQYRLELAGVPLDVDPGRYSLTASLASRPTPDPARVGVTVTSPTGG